jgi:hypothetical protein
MGTGVLVIGSSGMGKSASMRNFDNLAVINVLGKPFPFKNDKIKAMHEGNPDRIIEILQKAKANSIAIDDAGYINTNFYMQNKAPITAKMGDKYAVYDSLATNFWKIINSINALPDEKIVYIFMHEDISDSGKIKPKTIGKLLDDKICIEGYFSIVLRAEKFEGKYIFQTNTDGVAVTKSPMDMFPETIENDLQIVDKTIRKYYGLVINPPVDEKKAKNGKNKEGEQ